MVQVRKRLSKPGRRHLKLAPGIELRCDAESSAALLLVSRAGNVQLNQHALAILELCDGSRSRDGVVMDAIVGSNGAMRPSEAIDFLDAALARGWIVEKK